MLDFLLAKYPKFLNKFREYSREDDIFCQAVDDYIQKKEIEMHPLSEKIQTTYNTSTTYNGNDFDITFSDASNFILAKNKTIEDDRTNQAHIFIFNKVGRTWSMQSRYPSSKVSQILLLKSSSRAELKYFPIMKEYFL